MPSYLTSYPYNILAGVALIGTSLFFLRRLIINLTATATAKSKIIILLLIIILSMYFRYFAGGVCRSNASLAGKTVIITGANTGIGKETAIDMAKRQARVIMACRSVERGEKAAKEVRKASGSTNVEFHQLDLASLASVRRFCEHVLEEESHIDILINNAGIMACPYQRTEDGFEMQFGVNHLGHFLLTNLLLDRLKEAPAARIVNVSALAYKIAKRINFDDINSEQSYVPLTAYCQSKLANILFTRSLAKRLEGTKVTSNCLHPGVIRTELGRHMNQLRLVS